MCGRDTNDLYGLGAWEQATGAAGKTLCRSDGNGELTKALGLDIDLSVAGLGTRSKRYSMLVEDGVVKQLNIEESPGQADKSSAEALLEKM